MKPAAIGTRGEPVGLQLCGAASTEATLSIAFAVSIDDRAHTLTLLLPWEAVGDLLAAREQALPRADRASQAAMADALADATVELRAEVGSRALPLDEIARLRPGDVLRLERSTEQGITLLVGDTTLYRGKEHPEQDRAPRRIPPASPVCVPRLRCRLAGRRAARADAPAADRGDDGAGLPRLDARSDSLA